MFVIVARRLVLAGTKVILGSRDAGRARDAAKALSSETGKDVASDANAAAAAAADVVIATVPYAAPRAALAEIERLIEVGRGYDCRGVQACACGSLG